MQRHSSTAQTPWGPVKIKIASWQGIEKVTPEYEDCRKIASENNVPLREVIETVMKNLE